MKTEGRGMKARLLNFNAAQLQCCSTSTAVALLSSFIIAVVILD
jgi:hypothetical protein